MNFYPDNIHPPIAAPSQKPPVQGHFVERGALTPPHAESTAKLRRGRHPRRPAPVRAEGTLKIRRAGCPYPAAR